MKEALVYEIDFENPYEKPKKRVMQVPRGLRLTDFAFTSGEQISEHFEQWKEERELREGLEKVLR